MAVLIEDASPVAVTIELLDAVTDELGVDVWESVEAYEEFVQSTLMPAMGKVASARGFDRSTMGEPEVTITEVHRLVR